MAISLASGNLVVPVLFNGLLYFKFKEIQKRCWTTTSLSVGFHDDSAVILLGVASLIAVQVPDGGPPSPAEAMTPRALAYA
mmetsp:Transcript_9885/g.21401  ORF Transcript_9885/g.21401 Transcript_9885/m.21401 type:complete len:81 (+) Transcript_9885:194-436(+)